VLPVRPPLKRASPRPSQLQAAWAAAKQAAGFATTSKDSLDDFLEQATGPEREELEAKAKGIENPWHEAWWVLLFLLPHLGLLAYARIDQRHLVMRAAGLMHCGAVSCQQEISVLS
jgi:hypothetical protein